MQQYPTEAAPAIRHYLFAFTLCFLLWLLLTGSLHPQELLAGLAVAFITVLVAGPRLIIFSGLRLTPASPLHLVRYLLHFLLALVKANLDMARRVLSPSLPLRPAVVEVKTGLSSSLGRLLLANSITLTPGTLSVDVQGERILVHWVDCPPGTDLQAATDAIAAGFERHISGFLR